MRDTYLDMYLDMTGIAKVTKEKGCKSVNHL